MRSLPTFSRMLHEHECFLLESQQGMFGNIWWLQNMSEDVKQPSPAAFVSSGALVPVSHLVSVHQELLRI